MKHWIISSAILGLALYPLCASAQNKPEATPPKQSDAKQPFTTKEASVTIDGKRINYTVTAGELELTDDDGKGKATIFHVSYLKKNVADSTKQPVMFAFNGGPGSSAVWLHLGALGPRIVPVSADGTQPLTPPSSVVENPYSILDQADLVFIDPVSTGLSRVKDAKESGNYHGLHGDVASISDFIRRWITDNKRWASPKYIIGESYGGVRASALSQHLQQRYGLQVNGVIILSGLLDFRTLSPSNGNDLAYVTALPSLTSTAHFHKQIKGERDQLVTEARKFAASDYLLALHRGQSLSPDERTTIATKLSQLTGLSTEWIIDNNLRISPSKFRYELLKKQGKVLGRFDTRVAWSAEDSASQAPSYDPSFAMVHGAFSSAMLDYLGRDLGITDKRVYEILTSKVHPWKWDTENEYVNVAGNLSSAMINNPKLRVLVQCGHTDLATPPGAILYSIDHLEIPASLRSNITTRWYDAGHMFYLNQPDLIKNRKDLVEFLNIR